MAIEIQEKLQVQAPIDTVWRFVTDPDKVVVCMPGASLGEKVGEHDFIGDIKVKLGAITTSYKCKIAFSRVDDAAYVLEVTGSGKEKGGGTAKGDVTIALGTLPEGLTEMSIDAKIDLTGRVMQVGRGMIKGVSHQLFLQFAEKAKGQLETPAGGESAAALPAVQEDEGALNVGAIVGRTLWASIVNFFKRLFGRADAQ